MVDDLVSSWRRQKLGRQKKRVPRGVRAPVVDSAQKGLPRRSSLSLMQQELDDLEALTGRKLRDLFRERGD